MEHGHQKGQVCVCVSAFWPRFSVKAKVSSIHWDRKCSSGLLPAFQKQCLSLVLQSHSCLGCLTLSAGSGRTSQFPGAVNAKPAGKKDLGPPSPIHTLTALSSVPVSQGYPQCTNVGPITELFHAALPPKLPLTSPASSFCSRDLLQSQE